MNESRQFKLAKELRQSETKAEQILWSWLRNKQVNGVKFRRQQPIGDYIVDFIAFDKRIIIEIDGGQHNETKIMERDEQRTIWLKANGFRVIRFWNNEVIENAEGVIIRLKEYLDNVSPSP